MNVNTYLNALPAQVPVPELHGHVVTTGKHDASEGMHSQASDAKCRDELFSSRCQRYWMLPYRM